jgi:RNA polymerase sigma factor (sigma-70 family)
MIANYQRAKAGDPSATAAVADALRCRLTRMAAYYGRRCQEDPDDLLQEAWVGLLEALRDVDPAIGSPEHYLVQRARWRMLDAVRRATLRRCLPLDTVADSALPTMAWTDGASIESCVAEFSARLNPTQQAVLQCLLIGQTWREAGGALGCTSANIAYHVRQIKRHYEEWNGGA